MSESNASLPDFIKTGMDFFTGKTVAKHLLDTAEARSTALEQELTQAKADLGTARASIKSEGTQVKDLQDQLATKAEEIKTKDSEIAQLKGDAKTGARQAADILAKTGIDPVTTAAPKSTELTKGFAELVKEQQAQGKTKGAAVQYVIAEFPDQYTEWKKAGAGKL